MTEQKIAGSCFRKWVFVEQMIFLEFNQRKQNYVATGVPGAVLQTALKFIGET